MPRSTVTFAPIQQSGADPHGRLHDALVLDGHVDVVVHVVEVADVDPVGHDRALAELDVEVAVDRVVAAEDALVADAQRALVRAQPVLVADVHPAPEDEPRVAGAGEELDALADEDHALGDDVRVQQAQPQQPPVAVRYHAVERAVAPAPAQRVPGDELRLARVARRQAAHASGRCADRLQDHGQSVRRRLGDVRTGQPTRRAPDTAA